MAAVVSWYGPLIDLSAAASHVGGFVQLLAVVRRLLPHQVMRNPKSDIQLCSCSCASWRAVFFGEGGGVYYVHVLRSNLFFPPFLGAECCDRKDVSENHCRSRRRYTVQLLCLPVVLQA
jgi:hypothetical protein